MGDTFATLCDYLSNNLSPSLFNLRCDYKIMLLFLKYIQVAFPKTCLVPTLPFSLQFFPSVLLFKQTRVYGD